MKTTTFRAVLAASVALLTFTANRAEATPVTFSDLTSRAIPDNNFVSSTIVTPAGAFTLRLADDSFGDVGVLAGGWSITFDVVNSAVTDVNVTLFGLSHTFFADLDISLLGPVGALRDLTSDNGGNFDALNAMITFDDQASISLTNAAAFVNGFLVSGSYRTESAPGLSIYNGLSFVTAEAAVPESGSIVLLGIGLVTLSFGLRRRPVA